VPYSQLFYHLVWATKRREPLLTAETEPIIYGFLRSKAVRLGVQVFALNGIEDHVHLIASIPPSIAVASFVGQVKATAATQFNKAHTNYPAFFWQQEYGAFTLDSKRLAHHVDYVLAQKEHHRRGTVIPMLERSSPDRSAEPPTQEDPASA
jgi:REP element-mobilizing transposase RayT